MDEIYNSIDYTVSDIAYIKNSLPKFVIKTKFEKPFEPSTCDDYNTKFTNLLSPPSTIDKLSNYILWAQEISSDVSINDCANIWFYIKNIVDNRLIQSLLTESDITRNYRDIDIARSILVFRKNYEHKFNKRDIFRQLVSKPSSDHVITSSTKTFTLKKNYTLNQVFNSIQLSENFPICKYIIMTVCLNYK